MFEERYLKEAALGVPKNVMIRKCGGSDGFKEECKDGNVWNEEQPDGKVLWFMNTVSNIKNCSMFT